MFDVLANHMNNLLIQMCHFKSKHFLISLQNLFVILHLLLYFLLLPSFVKYTVYIYIYIYIYFPLPNVPVFTVFSYFATLCEKNETCGRF